MKSELLENVRIIRPYVAGEQPKGEILKLNTNENPYPPSKAVTEAVKNYNSEGLRRYPSADCDELKSAIAEFLNRDSKVNLDKNQIFVGNGSDEVLGLIFMCFFNSDNPVLFPDITYSFYDVWCELFNIKYGVLPLREDFTIDKEDYTHVNGGIVLANPNAPTGIYEDISTIEYILNQNKNTFVIIDEAYIDFGGQSALRLLPQYENLIIVRTLSKSHSLAGMRLGYAVGSAEAMAYLETIKNSFNSYLLDSIAQLAGIASMNDYSYFSDCINKITATREKFIKSLDSLGFKTLPSKANFVFTRHEKYSGQDIFNYLKNENIYVRYFNKNRINNYLRISIGTDEEMERLVDALCKLNKKY